jgi:hypothetical protein
VVCFDHVPGEKKKKEEEKKKKTQPLKNLLQRAEVSMIL